MNATETPNVLQQSVIINNNSDPNRQVIFLRKPSSSPEDIALTNSAKKRSSKTMTRVHNPPPVAVARRNARERNRVKQVNNGFATLRQHIPTAIAATYESGSGRGSGSNKKPSKVETLRMAVDYIKGLEKLLSISEESSSSNSNNFSDIDENIPQFTYTYSKNDEDRLKKSYLMYEDEENIHPLKMEAMEGMQEELLRDSMATNLENDISLLHSIDNTASLSPEVYSEHSLSPMGLETNETKSYIPVFNVPSQNILPSFAQISYDRLPQVKLELLSPNAHQVVDDSPSDSQTVCIITRSEDDHNPIEVMWWNQQQQTS